MELSIQVKGYLVKAIADIFSWDKIGTIARMTGVDPSPIINKLYSYTKLKASQYIIDNLPKDKEEQLLKVVLEMSQKGTYDKDFQDSIFKFLQPIVQDTMGYRLQKNGNLIPIFDESFKLEEQQNFILTKLTAFGFEGSKKHYQDALQSFSASPKGAIGLLRSSYEALVNDILTSKGIASTGNMKDNLSKLETIRILIEIDTTECPHCHYKKKDNEFNFSYDLFSMLSHYASHTEIMSDEVAGLLFPTVSSFLRFLLVRFESLT